MEIKKGFKGFNRLGYFYTPLKSISFNDSTIVTLFQNRFFILQTPFKEVNAEKWGNDDFGLLEFDTGVSMKEIVWEMERKEGFIPPCLVLVGKLIDVAYKKKNLTHKILSQIPYIKKKSTALYLAFAIRLIRAVDIPLTLRLLSEGGWKCLHKRFQYVFLH